MKKIKLGNGGYSTVDDDDYDRLVQHHWFKIQAGYAARKGYGRGGKTFYMHRDIMCPGEGLVVDHIDGDKLDNRKENLRVCRQSENSRNSRKNAMSSSKYKGVGTDKGKGNWRAFIMKDRKYYHLGNFKNEIDAAKAYNEAAIRLHGKFALINKLEG